jgi:dTDP-glucose pyrophosphorylase
MINIIIPIASDFSPFKSKFKTSKNLLLINGQSLIVSVINNFNDILNSGNKVFFVISKLEDEEFKTSSIIKSMLPNSHIIFSNGNTAGSIASILLAIDLLNPTKPLLILGGDQIISIEIKKVLDEFISSRSNHIITVNTNQYIDDSSYSFARIVGNDVYYLEEKKEISNNALTGVYFFNNTSIFLNSCIKYILNFPEQDVYFISQVINLMIEGGQRFKSLQISSNSFVKYTNSILLKEKIK